MIGALMLAGCQHGMPTREEPPPPVLVVTAKVPLATRCGAAERIGPEPDYAATDAKILDVPHKGPIERLSDQQVIENLYYEVNILSLDRLQRIRRDFIKSQAIASC
jgi:hypothetical protein